MQYINKDITTVTRGVVAHGVNCQGKMGSGVALAIKNKWPSAYTTYRSVPTGKQMLGACIIVTIEEDLFVANCFTQVFYGIGGRFASPDAIKESLQRAFEWAMYFDVPLYMPKIGSARGGLDWDTEVVPIISKLEGIYPQVKPYICVIEESDNVTRK